MKPGLRRYPAVKDSGVGWLRGVPEHWEVRKLKYAVSFMGGGTPSKANASFWSGHVPWASPKDMTRARLNDTTDHISEDAVEASAANIVAPDAVLMVVRSGILRRTIPVAINTVPMAINQDMKALRPKHEILKSQYLHGLIQGNETFLLSEWTKQGATVESIEHSLLANSPIPIPPPSEQTAIVRFLDHADRRIRRYIRAKERLVELLEERKRALIHEAVTGRIDVRTGQPYPAYKDSGVEWLGKVPEHWGVVQLGRIAGARCDGPFGSGLKSSHYTDGGVRVVRLQNIGHGEFRNDDPAFVSAEHYSTLGDHSVVPEDVLIAGLGDRNHPAGRACVAPRDIGPTMVKADCFRFRLDRSQALPRFVALQLTATALGAAGLSRGATRQRINLSRTSGRRITLPTIQQQRSIIEYVTREIVSTSMLQDNAERQIDLLHEYRTRLIADVVTGKVDVREAAADLPETDPLARNRDRADTIPTEASLHSTPHEMAKEASA